MLNSKVVILSSGKLIGPFENETIAKRWIDNQLEGAHDNCELYSLREMPLGTVDTAHECGTRISVAA